MIEIKNIHKTYRMGNMEVHALSGVSLKISQGEFVAIMGPSGSGKSTLMHVIGLLDRPDSGSYTLDSGGPNGDVSAVDARQMRVCGEKVGKTASRLILPQKRPQISMLSDRELSILRSRTFGFVFQQFHLLPRMSALENVELPLIYAGKKHLKENAKEKLALVGLGDRANHNPNELSGGQQQRVAIARSLVNDPAMILADEPTGNLDSKSKEEIIAILKKLNDEGKTVIIVTHESEIAAHAKRVIKMSDGKVVSDSGAGHSSHACHPRESGDLVDARDPHLRGDDRRADPDSAISGMKFFDYLRQAVFSMLSHKLRSVLSILGVLIGVGAVVAMLALGQGAKSSIESQLSSLGANLLMVRPGSAKLHGVAMQSGEVTRLTMKDVVEISRLTNVVKAVSPSLNGRAQLVYMDKNWNTQVEGVGVEYEELRAAYPIEGRFFTEEEVRRREKVALLGMTVVKELFGDSNPVGQNIKVNLINFKVIGILPQRGASTWHDQDDILIMPVTTAMDRVFGKDYLSMIYVEANSPDALKEAEEEISALIIREHRLLTKEQKDSFQIRNLADIRATLEATTKTMSLLLGSIAAISLLVGGIGIMNITLVSVTERTREIGLRKAIGAKESDILVQFLCESTIMSLIGGVFGICVGFLIALLMIIFAGWAVKVSLFSILLATLFSFAVGVVFGIWPAHQASKLNPIEALRYE